jgi:multiple sugar transport system substrate-binding protein
MSKIPRRARPALLTAALLVAGSTLTVVPAAAQEEPRFDGVTINLVTFSGPPIYEPLQRHALAWQELTGGTVNITTYPFSDLYQKQITDAASGTNSVDVYTIASGWLGDFASAGYIDDLSETAPANPRIAWEDVTPFFRDLVASYGGKVYGVVFDGDFLMGYYRTDILGEAGVEPPKTWDEYLAIAEQFHGQDLNGDGTPDYGSCIPKARGGVGTWHFNGVLSSFTQTQGTTQGAFFGEDMEPLVNNEAMAAALDFWQKSSEFGPPDEINLDQAGARGLFTTGRCALSIDWGDMGALALDPEQSTVKDKVGAVVLPGTTRVLDRATGALVDCDETTCPHAIDGVNHAPFAAFGGWAALINANADPEVKEAALDYISYVVAPEQSNPDVTVGATGLNPYRQSQLEYNDTWAASGWSQEAADLYLGPIKESLENPNMALDIRIGQANQYGNVLEDQAIAQFLAGELTREETMQQIYDAWQALTDQIGREQQAAAYADSLNVER